MCKRILRLHRMVRRSEDLVFEPVPNLNLTGWLRGVENLILNPVGSISCGMVRRPTGLASDSSEVGLCAHRDRIN